MRGKRSVQKYQGSCHCGAIQFEIETDFPDNAWFDVSVPVGPGALAPSGTAYFYRLRIEASNAQLQTENDNLKACDYQGTGTGDQVVTEDGIPIAGWYIPAGNGAGPTAPTIVSLN